MENGSQYIEGKQSEDPRPPDNPDNASLGLKIRGDVRRCCVVISGGVYENLLFFPTIQLIKNRYPGVQIDVVASPRGKQSYELNKNVRWADAYDPDEDFPDPAEYTDMIGIIKIRHYEMILSTKLPGLGHASFLFMSTARDRVSYIYPNVNSAGAVSQTFTPDTTNLSEGGYHMYHQMVDWLARPARNVPKEPVAAKYKKAGAEKGNI